MEFEIAQVESFSLELARSPKPVQNAVFKRVLKELRTEADKAAPPKIKKLTDYKDLWRYRINDSYRLVYRVDRDPRRPAVTLLLLGDRKDVYKRLGADFDGRPGIRVIASGLNDLIERDPTPAQFTEAFLAAALEAPDDPDPDAPLPFKLTSELLEKWGVSSVFHQVLIDAKTEGQLLAADVPGEVIEMVMNGLWPPTIEDVIQQPVRVRNPDDDDSAHLSDVTQTLSHLLLKLDSEQQSVVSRFDRADPQGPWLLKGGPGSGKSVVALYCIKALIDQENAKLPGQRRKLRILLTTYTNSLVNAAKQLSEDLLESGHAHTLDLLTVDSIARRYAGRTDRQLKSNDDPVIREIAKSALKKTKAEASSFPFGQGDITYLVDEIEWVIVGQDLRTSEEYVENADRTGRRRALGRRQREQVWSFYEAFSREQEKRRVALWIDRQRDALERATPSYDYVFVDEAQDLKPVAVRLVQRLAKRPESLFLTADANQSIYGTGLSWARIAADVNFSGRAQILKRNYRTTVEIWEGVVQLAPEADDAETLTTEPVFHGHPPQLVYHRSDEARAERLNRYLFESLRSERLGPDSAAVLVPWNKMAEKVVSLLSPELRPKAFTGNTMDIRHPGVKVLTMHSAKGLEFPVVAIIGADKEALPGTPFAGQDPEDHQTRQHRLLFVAATRAMRRLMIMASEGSPSPFLRSATSDYWELDHI